MTIAKFFFCVIYDFCYCLLLLRCTKTILNQIEKSEVLLFKVVTKLTVVNFEEFIFRKSNDIIVFKNIIFKKFSLKLT